MFVYSQLVLKLYKVNENECINVNYSFFVLITGSNGPEGESILVSVASDYRRGAASQHVLGV